MSETPRLTAEQLAAIEARRGHVTYTAEDGHLSSRFAREDFDTLVAECRRLLGENQRLRDALAKFVLAANEDAEASDILHEALEAARGLLS